MSDKKGNAAAATATGPADAKKAPPAAPAPPARKKTKGSFKFVMSYSRRECCSIIFGMIFLVGGATSDLAVPYFIGRIIDAINKGDYDKIGDICFQFIAVIVVSILTSRQRRAFTGNFYFVQFT